MSSTLTGSLELTAVAKLADVMNDVTYSGSPSISITRQIKSPTYTLAYHGVGTISGGTTLNLFGTAATASGVLTFGTPTNGSTVVITGPTSSPVTYTKAASAGGLNFADIDDLTDLINDIPGLSASNDATDITITVTVGGTDANSWTITGTSSYSGLNITFSLGDNSDLVNVFGEAINFSSVKLLVLHNAGSANLTPGGGSNSLFAAQPPITADGSLTLDTTIALSGNNKNLLLTPAASLEYELLIFGT